jgi:hypothetical protein
MGEAPSPTDGASKSWPAIDLPGLSELRDAVANRWWPKLPGFAALRRDGLAGLSSAISNVPDGTANGVLVGVNPVCGLYATMMGPAVDGLFSSTHLMMMTTTTAASLSISQARGGLQGERAEALSVMVMLAGAFQDGSRRRTSRDFITQGATLPDVDGQLYLTGISRRVHDQVVRTGKLRLSGPVQVYEATPVHGQSTRQAVEDARTWLVGAKTEAQASDSQ